jgi:hypothetical protein
MQIAKEKTGRVVDHLHYLLALLFQQGMHQFEVVRLCALWDRAELEKDNIPTIIELIDDPDVIDALVQETSLHWQNMGDAVGNPSSDPELRALEEQAFQQANEQFGEEQARKARDELRKAMAGSRDIIMSTRLASIMNLRDKHLAHSLSTTRREKKGALPPMRYGDERDILDATIPIVETLYCWVNGSSLSFQDSRDIDRKNAKALWGSCTFTITN